VPSESCYSGNKRREFKSAQIKTENKAKYTNRQMQHEAENKVQT
jgi:hypothetical protein